MPLADTLSASAPRVAGLFSIAFLVLAAGVLLQGTVQVRGAEQTAGAQAHQPGGQSASSAAAAPTGALADRVAALTKDFKGTTVLYAKHLGNGRELAVGADTKVRTASTIKLPILCALESLIAAGKVRWDDRVVLKAEDKVSGSGVLGDLADGTDLTVRNLAILMIIVSDNTATNLILDRITADAVNDYLDTIGLTQTRANRKVRGDGTKLAAPTGSHPNVQSPHVGGPGGWSKAGMLDENKKFGLGVSTPREMVRLLARLHEGKIVSPEVSRDIIGILKQQQIKAAIGRHAPGAWTIASKSGSLDALRSDVALVYTKGGPIAMAITVDGMPETDYSPDNVGEKLIWEVTKVVVDGLSSEGAASGAGAGAAVGVRLLAAGPPGAGFAGASLAHAALTTTNATRATKETRGSVAMEATASTQASPQPPATGRPAPPPPGRLLLGKFDAISNTAMSITGNLVVSEHALAFSLDQKYETRFVRYAPASEDYAKGAGSWADLQNVPRDTPVEVRAVTSEAVGPKAPNKGLCAPAKTTFVALVSSPDATGGPALALAAFKGKTPPAPDTPAADLCGTFRYAPAAAR